jgi:hypothetical protein
MRELLFGKSLGEWKRKNPFGFALLAIGFPAIVLLIAAGSLDGMTLAYVVGIWLAVAVLVIYVPLKVKSWLGRRRDG